MATADFTFSRVAAAKRRVFSAFCRPAENRVKSRVCQVPIGPAAVAGSLYQSSGTVMPWDGHWPVGTLKAPVTGIGEFATLGPRYRIIGTPRLAELAVEIWPCAAKL